MKANKNIIRISLQCEPRLNSAHHRSHTMKSSNLVTAPADLSIRIESRTYCNVARCREISQIDYSDTVTVYVEFTSHALDGDS